jgi:hypothetical protein
MSSLPEGAPIRCESHPPRELERRRQPLPTAARRCADQLLASALSQLIGALSLCLDVKLPDDIGLLHEHDVDNHVSPLAGRSRAALTKLSRGCTG